MPDMVNTQMVGATPAADVPDAPVVTVDTASIATTLALTTLDASGSSDPAGGSLSFAWTMDTKPTGSAAALSGSATATETFTPDKSGTYSGSATATSSVTGKSASTRWVRRVRGALSAAFGSDSYQQADTTAITGLATQLGGLTVSGGVTPYTYSWTINGAATGLSDAAAADPNVTVTALDGGTLVNARHAVECTVTDAAGNTATAAGWVEIGDASNATAWQTIVDIDMASLDAADWTTGSHTLNGAALTINAPAACDVLGPDGVNGVQFSQTGAASYRAADRSSGAVSVRFADWFAGGVPANAVLAFMSSWSSAQALGTSFLYCGHCLEPTSPTGADQMYQSGGDRFDGRHAHTLDRDGGASTAYNLSGLGGRPVSFLMVWSYAQRTCTMWYSLSAKTAPPDMSDLVSDGWVQYGDDAIKGHLHAQGGAVYTPATDLLSLFQGGDIAWDCTLKHVSMLMLEAG